MGLDELLPELMSVKELSELINISESTVWRAIRDDKLKALRFGKNVRIEKKEVIKWAKER